MRYLIDTNILVYLLSVSEKWKLSKDVERILDDYYNQIYISSEAILEFFNLIIAKDIKIDIDKNKNLFELIENELRITIKYFNKEHLQTFYSLPILNNTKDKTDRMIIAHAITEDLTLISSDTKFPVYRKCGLKLVENKK
jgi:PIN domain nuclease of toxin-antitoxin system